MFGSLSASPLASASVEIWVPVVTTALAALLGFAGGLGLDALRNRRRGKEAAAAVAHDEQKAIITALAPIEHVLVDIAPSRLAINASQATFDQLLRKRDDWNKLRDQVAIASQLHRDPTVRHGAARLNVHVANTFTSGSWLVADLARQNGGMKFNLAMARADHAAATSVLGALMDAVRRHGNSNLEESIAEIERAREAAEEAALKDEESREQ